VLILVGLSVVMAFVFNLSGQNVLVAICLHAMFNTTSRWMTALLADVPLRENLSAELVIGVCGIVAAVLLIVFSKGRLGLPAVNADV
jgi:drug/metabolite transporter (DMT)-like permease